MATPALSHSFSSIDKNVKRGIMHKNTAARKKSQLALKVKAREPGAAADQVLDEEAWLALIGG